MKKSIVLSILLVLFSLSLTAGPAYPGRIVYTQPDGSKITIYLHGDEYAHWMTNESGTIVVSDEDGYIKPADASYLAAHKMKLEEASVLRAQAWETMKAATSTSNNFGSPNIPVLMVGFKDYPITKTQAQFDAMLNLPGYSENSAKGSVWDYFNENSFGQFTPAFDVLEPINLTDDNVATYGNSDGNARNAIIAAMDQLNATVDFSRYDNDHDGYIDFVILYFGGYDEAQCPQTSAYTKFIWSHASAVSSSKVYDGVKIGKYFCTSELKGYTGSTMCSIGTTCHEFSHTLGLPDFYDVRYQNGDSNTQSANMYDFDLMASGSYNGNSTCPPYLNAEELMEIGWLSSIPEISENGSYTLPAINYQGATAYSAYMSKTSVNNEYFIYETRGGTRWDASLPGSGLLVYHVDKSTNRISGSITAASVWGNNYVNSYANHPCCYVVPAPSPNQTNQYTGSARNMLFGSTYRSFSPVAWNGNSTGFQLTSITYSSSNNGVTTFSVTNSNTLGISGIVMNTDGEPISGVTMTISSGSGISSSPVKSVKKTAENLLSKVKMLLKPSAAQRKTIAKAPVATIVTDEDGCYSVELAAGTYQVMASKEGYVSQTATVTVTSVIETQDFYLMREGESLPSEIYAWPTDLEDEYIVGSSATSLTGQNFYPSSEISKYAGKQIKEITFFLYGSSSTTYQGVNVIIDYNDERKATVAVPTSDLTIGGYTTVDLRDQELVIPSGKDIYAGVGYSSGGYYDSSYQAYFSFGAFYKTYDDEDGNEQIYDWAVGWPYDGLVSEYNLTATGERYSWDLIFDFVLTVGDYEAPELGYNYIADPKNGSYSAGDEFALTLVETTGDRKPGTDIAWYYDDEPVSDASVTLSSGNHVVEARFTTTEGKRKVVELEINVN